MGRHKGKRGDELSNTQHGAQKTCQTFRRASVSSSKLQRDGTQQLRSSHLRMEKGPIPYEWTMVRQNVSTGVSSCPSLKSRKTGSPTRQETPRIQTTAFQFKRTQTRTTLRKKPFMKRALLLLITQKTWRRARPHQLSDAALVSTQSKVSALAVRSPSVK